MIKALNGRMVINALISKELEKLFPELKKKDNLEI
jgi:hypothetical protein